MLTLKGGAGVLVGCGTGVFGGRGVGGLRVAVGGTVGWGVGVMLGVRVGAGVSVGSGVSVGTGVTVGVWLGEGVGLGTRVFVAVAAGVKVGFGVRVGVLVMRAWRTGTRSEAEQARTSQPTVMALNKIKRILDVLMEAPLSAAARIIALLAAFGKRRGREKGVDTTHHLEYNVARLRLRHAARSACARPIPGGGCAKVPGVQPGPCILGEKPCHPRSSSLPGQ
jgi:hypothetical protein